MVVGFRYVDKRMRHRKRHKNYSLPLDDEIFRYIDDRQYIGREGGREEGIKRGREEGRKGRSEEGRKRRREEARKGGGLDDSFISVGKAPWLLPASLLNGPRRE